MASSRSCLGWRACRPPRPSAAVSGLPCCLAGPPACSPRALPAAANVSRVPTLRDLGFSPPEERGPKLLSLTRRAGEPSDHKDGGGWFRGRVVLRLSVTERGRCVLRSWRLPRLSPCPLGCRAERFLPSGSLVPTRSPVFHDGAGPRAGRALLAFTCVLPALPALICSPTIHLSTRRPGRTQDTQLETLLPECPATAVRPWFLPFRVHGKGHRLDRPTVMCSLSCSQNPGRCWHTGCFQSSSV